MADNKPLVDKSLEELEREITCAICLHHFTQPKVLPCCLFYCKQCILNLVPKTGTEKPFSCPECCKEVIFLDGSVDQLPTAFIVNRFKVAFAALEQAHGKVEVKCAACKDSVAKAEAFCRQCAVFVCQECVKSHQRLNIFDGHEVVSLEELKLGKAKVIVVKEPPAKKCLVHDEQLKMYCFDCDCLICHQCIMDHKDHKFEFSYLAAANTRKQLMEKMEHLREVEVCLSRAVEEIQTTKRGLQAQGDSVVDTIHTSFEELQKILGKRKRGLLEDAAGRVGEKTVKLLLQEKNLSLANAEVQSVGDYAEQYFRQCADNEVISMQVEITSQIEREIEEHGKLGRSMEPVEEVDVGVEVRCAEAMQQLSQTIDEITQLTIDPSKCTFTVEVAETVEVNSVSELTLTARLSNNQPTKCICKVDCHLKSLTNGSIIKCNADRIGASINSIQFRPTVRGRHELTVSGRAASGRQSLPCVCHPPPNSTRQACPCVGWYIWAY